MSDHSDEVNAAIQSLVDDGLLEVVDETTPPDEYDGGTGLIIVHLTVSQATAIVVGLLEIAKQSTVGQQLDLSRLALAINDLIVEAEHGAEPG